MTQKKKKINVYVRLMLDTCQREQFIVFMGFVNSRINIEYCVCLPLDSVLPNNSVLINLRYFLINQD